MSFLWQAFTDRGNLAGTVLNSLADNTLSAALTELNNLTNLDTHAVIEVNLGSAAFTAPAYLEIYMIKAPDGANYEDDSVVGSTDVNSLIVTLPIKAGTSAKRIMSGLISLPPFKVKFFVGNQGNVGLAASGNTFDVYTGRLTNT